MAAYQSHGHEWQHRESTRSVSPLEEASPRSAQPEAGSWQQHHAASSPPQIYYAQQNNDGHGDRNGHGAWGAQWQHQQPAEHDRAVTDKDVGMMGMPPGHAGVAEHHQHPQRRKPKVVRSWVFEILTVLVATGLLVAIYVILSRYNGQQTSEWTQSINLNTLVATLSTISRMALALVASEIISQAKWSWFWSPTAHPRTTGVPLHDMEAFDHASRGVWGSLLLLGKSVRRPDVLLTLIVLITSVAMGPFAQQAVRTVDCHGPAVSDSALIPNVQTLGNLGLRRYNSLRGGKEAVGWEVKAAIISSLSSPNASGSDITASCSTGNCTFPQLRDDDGQIFTHRAAGFCSRCTDVSSSLVFRQTKPKPESPCKDITLNSWTLPNGQKAEQRSCLFYRGSGYVTDVTATLLEVSSKDLNMTWPTSPTPEAADFLSASRYGLVNTSFISIAGSSIDPFNTTDLTNKPEAFATTCTLYPCLKTYSGAVSKGNFTETLVSSQSLTPYGDIFDNLLDSGSIQGQKTVFPSDMIAIRPPCVVDGKVYTSENISTAPGAATLKRRNYGNTTFPFTSGGTENAPTVDLTAPPECLYAVDTTGWYLELKDIIADALQGTCGLAGVTGSAGLCTPSTNTINSTTSVTIGIDPFWLEGIASIEKRTPVEISQFMNDVANSMTRRFRSGIMEDAQQIGGEEADKAYPWKVKFVKGEASRTTTCFAVDWRWLLLPSILTGLAALLLLWTIVYGVTRGQVVWKGSVLPFIYYRERLVGVDGQVLRGHEVGEGTPLMEVKEMEKDSKAVPVVFRG